MPPIRVLVVDDTVVVRRLVTDVLAGTEGIDVAGTAANGELALAAIESLRPDVITLDVEMPVLDGLATLKEIRRRWPDLPVIMFSTMTSRGAEATLDALALGANDYVTKPSLLRDRDAAMDMVRSSLVPMIRLWGRVGASGSRRTVGQVPAPAEPVVSPPSAVGLPEVDRRPPLGVVIGVSTGGPVALTTVLPALPADLGVPVVVVQHMPPMFTQLLAERLDAACALSVVEATEGMPLMPNRVHIAAGGFHLDLKRRGPVEGLHLDDGPMENSCRPSVDVTLRAAARLWGSRTLTVILTGMGSDGLHGAELLRRTGGRVIAQDAATSVVWGMPGAVTRAGLADAVLPLGAIAPAIVNAVRAPRVAPMAAGVTR